jgi:branched-chain amino acid transport system substrate-binding protein
MKALWGALAFVFTFYCGVARAEETIRIGYSEILSGTFAQVGDQGIKTIQFSIDQINARGGVLGKKLELVGV